MIADVDQRAPEPRALLREILVAAWSQRVSTLVTCLIIGGSALTILLTSGRSAAAEAAVLKSIDAQGTRLVTIGVKGEDPALSRAMVDDLAQRPEIEDVLGLGPVHDVTAAAIPDGTRVGARAAYGRMHGVRIEQTSDALGPDAWVTPAASRTLGMASAAGAVRLIGGEERLVTRSVLLPAYANFLEPAVLLPVAPDDLRANFSTIVILAREPSQVALVSRYARSLLADMPRETVSVTSSEQMAQLRRVIGGELTAQGRSIVLGVLAGATLATLVNVWGMTLMRRRDIGRRRALGATRTTIVTLMVGQVLVAALVAASLGAMTGLAALMWSRSALPAVDYTLAVVVALSAVSAVAAGIPALIAARRDPLNELRVP